VRLDWAWGLLRAELASGRGFSVRAAGLRVPRFGGGRREGRPARVEEAAPEEGGLDRLRSLLREREALLRMALRLARALHLRVRVTGTVGTGDPADTALLAGLLRALDELPGVELALGVEWVEEVLEIDAECAARIWVAEILVVAALLMRVRAHRAALRAAFS
jgi:hypothetical protein